MKPKCICDKLFTNIYNKLLLAFISLVKFYVQNKYLIYDTILDVCIEKQRHYIANKGPSSQGYSFSSGHVWMWELDCEESWVPKNWCFWIVMLEKTLESPLDCKEIQPVHPKGNQSWMFTGRTDAKAEAPILWPTHWKRPWCWERLRAGGEGDDRGWNGWMVSQTQWKWVWANSGREWRIGKPGFCSPWGHKESDTT